MFKIKQTGWSKRCSLEHLLLHICLYLQWNVSFPGSWKTRTGFSQPRVHTVMDRTSARRARVLPITVWTSGWENQFWFSNFLEEAFSEISLITWFLLSFLRKCKTLHASFLGKQKTPIEVSRGVFAFPNESKKLLELVLYNLISVISANCWFDHRNLQKSAILCFDFLS